MLKPFDLGAVTLRLRTSREPAIFTRASGKLDSRHQRVDKKKGFAGWENLLAGEPDEVLRRKSPNSDKVGGAMRKVAGCLGNDSQCVGHCDHCIFFTYVT